MPRVPVLDQFQVDTGSAPADRYAAPGFSGTAPNLPGSLSPAVAFSPAVVQPLGMPNVPGVSPELASLGSRQLQALGQSAEGLGDRIAMVAVDAQNQANTVRVMDARNQVKQAMQELEFAPETGFRNLTGSAAAGITETFGTKLRDHIEQIGGKLANDAQKEQFGMMANDMLAQFAGAATQHEAHQAKVYANSTFEGSVANSMNDVALNYNNPDGLQRAIGEIRAATFMQGHLAGQSPEWIDAKQRARTSDALKVAIGAAMQNGNTPLAYAIVSTYRHNMNADDLLHIQGLINRDIDTRTGTAVADSVMQAAAPRMETSDFDRAFNILIGSESGGRQFAADGSTLRNVNRNGTADHGIAQVNEKTGPEAAKLAGLEWDVQKYKNDPEYNRALGRAYFGQQVKDFDSLGKAYAAYNAGPGATRAAIAQAEKAGKPESWITFLPASTQEYVSKNVSAFTAGTGQFKMPTLEEAQTVALRELGPNPSPVARKVALDEVSRRFEVKQKAIKQQGEEAQADVIRELQANGGRWSAVDPLKISRLATYAPDKIDNTMSIGQKISKGDDVTDMRVYNELASNPTAMAKMTDAQFLVKLASLSQDDAKIFSKQRGTLMGNAPGGEGGPGDLNLTAINAALDSKLRMLGINPAPDFRFHSEELARVGGIRKFVTDQIAVAQIEAGKKFSDTEIASKIDQLFMRTDEFIRPAFLPNIKKPVLMMKKSDLPSKTVDEITAAYNRKGIKKPTDAQILDVYYRDKFTAPQ